MHYLDNSATTCVIKDAAQRAYDVMTINFGNPSSVHKMGIEAENILREACVNVSYLMAVDHDRLCFTSSGTESINTAIFGAVNKLKHKGKHIITTKVEHSATLQCMKKLASMGFDVTYLDCNAKAEVFCEDFENALRHDTIFASIILVNNEVGSVMDVSLMNDVLTRKNKHALFHVDAVQAFSKLDFRSFSGKVDFISISGHKIGAPKGVGALYIKRGINIAPMIFGGGQQNGMRSGTEALPNISALGVCALNRYENMSKNLLHVKELNRYLRKSILTSFDNAVINSPDVFDYILNVSFTGLKSEVTLRILQDNDVFVSAGSACSKNKKSHVLSAMNLPKTLSDSSLRVSFCPENTTEDIDCFIDSMKKANFMLRGTI